jgi:transcriptional regulator with XRE-family HTH domain
VPFQAESALKSWGQRIGIARKVRRWTIRDLAAKAGVSPSTVIAAERGDPGVRLDKWVRVLWSLELLDALNEAARAGTDTTEFRLMAERLPQRVRR